MEIQIENIEHISCVGPIRYEKLKQTKQDKIMCNKNKILVSYIRIDNKYLQFYQEKVVCFLFRVTKRGIFVCKI